MIKDTAQNVVATIFQRHLGVVVSAMSDELFWSFMCMCYLVGGITIGYYFGQWKNRKKKTGTGRWDYKDRHLP